MPGSLCQNVMIVARVGDRARAWAARLEGRFTPENLRACTFAQVDALPDPPAWDALLLVVDDEPDCASAAALQCAWPDRPQLVLAPAGLVTQLNERSGQHYLVIDRQTPDAGVWQHLQHLVWRSELARELQRAHQQLAQAHEHIAQLTDTDPLTGAANRDTFERSLALRLSSAHTARDHLALVCVDIDDFRTLNDQYGMANGDEVLRTVCGRIEALLGPADLLARVGADEFVIMLTEVTGVSDTHRIARALDDTLRAPLQVAGESLRLQATIGVAMFPFSATADDLMAHAEAAMRHAKEHTRGGIQFFDRGLADAHRQRRRISDLLLAAVPDQLIVRYQGIYCARTGRLERLEGLCNLPGDAPGPTQFVPVADELGLAPALTECVLQRAARDAGLRLRAESLKVAVNVTSRQLTNRTFPDVLVTYCVEAGLALAELQIEVHEREILGQVNQLRIRQTLAQLRELGAGIVIDDFGTGFASVAQLVQLPVTGVKLDRSLVSDMLSDRRKSSLCRGCVEMAHGLGLEVTAVGIESHDDLMLVSAMGCDYIQGDYLCPPGAIESVPAQIAAPERVLRGVAALPSKAG